MTSLPHVMRAAQWTSVKGGIERNIHVNPFAALPKNAASLPQNSTLVKVAYSTLNPVDYKIGEALPYILSKPVTPGYDYSGTVVASTIASLSPGTQVFGKTFIPGGCLAEFITVTGQDACIPIPSGLGLKDAACLGVAGKTAYDELYPFVKDLPKGARVLINGGSGGVGTFGIQIAKVLGCEVTATCSEPNMALCKDLGADHVINYRIRPLVQSLEDSDTPFDLIVDNVMSSADLYNNSQRYLKPSGRYLTIAGVPSFGFVWMALKIMMWPSILGGGNRTFSFVNSQADFEGYTRLAEWVATGKVKAVIEKTYTLEQCGDAFFRMKSGRTRGKLVVEVAGK